MREFLSAFVTYNEEYGSYRLTRAGTIGLILLIVIAAVCAAFLARGVQSQKRPMSAKTLAFCSLSIALAMVTSNIKLYHFPFGGSITLLSMLFACLPGYFYGLGTGLLAAAAYGILQVMVDPYILFPLQLLVDYPLAFGALGLSGLFANSRHGLIKGYIAGILGRYVFVVLSGWLFFGEYAWEGWGALPYSLAYNGAYIFSEAAITIVILLIPAVSRAFATVKQQAAG